MLGQLLYRNAKLAIFEYYVNGRKYISNNSIKMLLSANSGDYKILNEGVWLEKEEYFWKRSYQVVIL